MSQILLKLLDHLRTKQTWCPYCGGSVVHQMLRGEACILKGLWFTDERSKA